MNLGYSEQSFANKIQQEFGNVLDEKNKLESKENKRQSIYQSAKDVYQTEIKKNDIIVQHMYPNTHQQFTNDEKAFIVDEAQKGKIISTLDVQHQFKHNSQIPKDVLMEDTYKKASKDIFFSKRNLNQYEENSFEYHVEKQFINAKENELNSFVEHIDDDLLQEIGQRNFYKVKDQTPDEKVQLMIKLEKYNNVDVDNVIDKHNHQINDSYKHQEQNEEDYQQNKKVELPKIDLSQVIVHYANETERENQLSPKKKKKKNKYLDQQQRR